MRLASALSTDAAASPKVGIPGAAGTYARFAAELMTRDPQERFWDRFPPQSPAGLLIELVAPERPFDESAVAAVRLMWTSRADVPWKDLVDAVSSRVGAGFASEAIVHLLAALHILVD